MRPNTNNREPITLGNTPLQEVDAFTYLENGINREAGTEEDVKTRVQKARGALITLRNIWESGQVKTMTKKRIFNTNVKIVLLYESNTRRTTKASCKRLQVFINRCLRTIPRLKWSDKTTNEDLLERERQRPVEQELGYRRWRGLGHTLRRPRDSITRQALS
jgi:hypothetical protein